MNQPAPFRPSTFARLAAFSVTLLTVATLGCAETSDRSIESNFAALRSIHNGASADNIGTLDATAPPANLSDYRHSAHCKVNAAYHPQPH